MNVLAEKANPRWRTSGDFKYRAPALFLESLGGFADAFAAALYGQSPEEIRSGEDAIRKAPPVVTTPSGGGLLHYRAAFRDDPHLRLWAGLVLLEAGRPALALGELAAANRLGLASACTADYRAEATRALDAPGPEST